MKTQLTPAVLKSIARKHNTTIRYGRYRMWFHVPFINDTALVVDNIVHGGGYRLLDVDFFLHPLSAEYVDAAITAGAHSLGELDLSNNRWKFKTWKEQMGKYPAGYFTHKVGDDVSAA